MRWAVWVVAMAACGDTAPTTKPVSPDVVAPPAEMKLVEVARTPIVARSVAIALDGRRWMVAGDRDLVVFEGDRETARFTDRGVGAETIMPLTDGAWLAAGRILAADGAIRFDGNGWAHRIGRFGHVQAIAATPDGRVVIVAGADAPSTDLRDRDRGRPGSWKGVLARLTLDGTSSAPVQRVLVEHANRSDFQVAASATSLAAIGDGQLRVWSTAGDDAPITVALESASSFRHVQWIGDRYLVATRYVDGEHDEVVVFDRDAKFARTSFVARGNIKAWAPRPGHRELALAISRYRATTTVEVDEKAIEIVDLAGTKRARVELRDYPVSVAWAPRGDALMVVESAPPGAVIRYAIR